MTRRTIARILPFIFAAAAIITSCTDEYKDMNPGEVRLKENDYRNDDKLLPVTVATAPATEETEDTRQGISALEMRILWHSVVISAEQMLENKSETEKNLYADPREVEEAFFGNVEQSMTRLQQQYPGCIRDIVAEMQRADIHAFVHYVWCTQPGEYVNLKFRATPFLAPAAPPAEDTDGDTPGTTD